MTGTPAAGSASTTATLEPVGLLAFLSAEELAALSARVRRRRYPKGAVIFLEGDPGASLYVVETGRVKIALTSPDGKELVIRVLDPGEFFGEMALLDGEPRSADAIAVEDCRLMLVHRDDFVRFLEAHPQAAVRLLAALSRRLRRATRQQQEAATLDVGARVASALLRLAEEHGAPAASGSGEIAVTTPLTQTQLAGMVGVTRESVNKWLRFYERRGLVRWQKGRLTVLRPDELRQRRS